MIYFSCLPCNHSPRAAPPAGCLLSTLPASSCEAVPGARARRPERTPLAEREGLPTSWPRRPTPAPSAGSQLYSQPSTDKPGFKSPLPWSPLRSGSPHWLSHQPPALMAEQRREPEPGRLDTTSGAQTLGPRPGHEAPFFRFRPGGHCPGPRHPRERLLPSSTAILTLSASSSPCRPECTQVKTGAKTGTIRCLDFRCVCERNSLRIMKTSLWFTV